jgi:hypothetical protein
MFEANHPIPGLTFIIAASLQRARELARRELLRERDGVFVEICEGNQLLCTETVRPG